MVSNNVGNNHKNQTQNGDVAYKSVGENKKKNNIKQMIGSGKDKVEKDC